LDRSVADRARATGDEHGVSGQASRVKSTVTTLT
jgi:hypothetical protein